MAKSTYEEALRRLLAHEGGYTNHPSDPGGPTNFGITIHDYRKYVKPNATAADVKAMKLSEAKAIYRAKYWDSQRCDDLPAGVDYCIFDYGVNSGIGRSAKVLQRLVGVPVDGRIGAATLAAVAKRDPATLVNAICNERLRFLQSLKTWGVFGKGWGRRVAEVKDYASKLVTAAAAASPQPKSTNEPAGKGEVPEAKIAKSVVKGAGPGAVIEEGARDGAGWLAWIAAHPIETGLAVAGFVALATLAIHFINRRRKAKQEAPVGPVVIVPEAQKG